MTSNPLDGPFMTALQLTSYADEPGWAIPPTDLPPAEQVAAEERQS